MVLTGLLRLSQPYNGCKMNKRHMFLLVKYGLKRQEDHLNPWNCCSMNKIPISKKKMLIFNTQWTTVAPFFENFE